MSYSAMLCYNAEHIMTEYLHMLPHHAKIFREGWADALLTRTPQDVAEEYSYNSKHRVSLQQALEDIYANFLDTPIQFVPDDYDSFCTDCPYIDTPFIILGVNLGKCEVKSPNKIKSEEKSQQDLIKLTGSEHPTLRQIYLASKEKNKKFWEQLKNGG